VSEDLLEELVRAALAEGTTLDAQTLPRFAQALRDRAALIVADREALEAERRAAMEAYERATAAHDLLLAHHRETLERLAEALGPLPARLPWEYRRVRAQILELLGNLRKEGP
jgi:hypothetical protein